MPSPTTFPQFIVFAPGVSAANHRDTDESRSYENSNPHPDPMPVHYRARNCSEGDDTQFDAHSNLNVSVYYSRILREKYADELAQHAVTGSR